MPAEKKRQDQDMHQIQALLLPSLIYCHGSMANAGPVVSVYSSSPSPVASPNVDVDSLTKLLGQRLELPNTADKIVYTKPCDPAGKGLTGCTSTCGNAPLLADKPLRDRVASLVQTPRLQLSPQQRGAILSMTAKIPETDVIIVSAASANHYNEMQAMFHGLHNVVYPVMVEQKRNFSVVLFDLGLTAEQKRIVRKSV
ncbi:hypothetical protein ElyMa_004316800 [Elysia marginata]|uniref:Uncharacterized protein n=1 Tax=Elysia marginata TaxID=1093978 RepID=A0AAV4GZU5_9GAST|nr:hypothetical protein ElyMa_004316800 [Elysia marginata]